MSERPEIPFAWHPGTDKFITGTNHTDMAKQMGVPLRGVVDGVAYRKVEPDRTNRWQGQPQDVVMYTRLHPEMARRLNEHLFRQLGHGFDIPKHVIADQSNGEEKYADQDGNVTVWPGYDHTTYTAASESFPYAMKLHIGYYLGFLTGYANTHVDFTLQDRLAELERHFSEKLWGDNAYKMGWDRAKAQGFYPDPNLHPTEQRQNEAPFASVTQQEANEMLAWLESHVAEDQMQDWQAQQFPDEPGKSTFPEEWTAGLHGDLPEEFTTNHVVNEDGTTTVNGMMGADPIGRMMLNANGQVSHVVTHPRYYRRGVATAMWNHAVTNGLNPQHTDLQTDAGSAWAQATPQQQPSAQPAFARVAFDPYAEDNDTTYAKWIQNGDTGQVHVWPSAGKDAMPVHMIKFRELYPNQHGPTNWAYGTLNHEGVNVGATWGMQDHQVDNDAILNEAEGQRLYPARQNPWGRSAASTALVASQAANEWYSDDDAEQDASHQGAHGTGHTHDQRAANLTLAVLDSITDEPTVEPEHNVHENDWGVQQHNVTFGTAHVDYAVYASWRDMYNSEGGGYQIDGPYFHNDNGEQPVLFVEMMNNGPIKNNKDWDVMEPEKKPMFNVVVPGDKEDFMDVVRWLWQQGKPVYASFVNPALKRLAERYRAKGVNGHVAGLFDPTTIDAAKPIAQWIQNQIAQGGWGEANTAMNLSAWVTVVWQAMGALTRTKNRRAAEQVLIDKGVSPEHVAEIVDAIEQNVESPSTYAVPGQETLNTVHRSADEWTPAAEGEHTLPTTGQPWHDEAWQQKQAQVDSGYGDSLAIDYMHLPLAYHPERGVFVGMPGQSHVADEVDDWNNQDAGIDQLPYEQRGQYQGNVNVIGNQYSVHWPSHPMPEQAKAEAHQKIHRMADQMRQSAWQEWQENGGEAYYQQEMAVQEKARQRRAIERWREQSRAQRLRWEQANPNERQHAWYTSDDMRAWEQANPMPPDPDRQARTASATMYHVSPARNRAQIARLGLTLSGQGRGHVWLFGSLSEAQSMVHKHWDASTDNDIWAVNTDGLDVISDPHYESNGGFGFQTWASNDPISPERLQLVTDQHTSAAQVMYHVAPVEQRDGITTSGLKPNTGRGITNASGVYLWPNEQHAHQWARSMTTPHDVWAVDTTAYDVQPDPLIATAAMTPSPIAAQHVRLHQTHEGSGPWHEHSASRNGQHWAYVDGHVAFHQHPWEAITQAARDAGHDAYTQQALSNFVARSLLPKGYNVAWGLATHKHPWIYASTIDRTHVWDAVTDAMRASDAPNDSAPAPDHNPRNHAPSQDRPSSSGPSSTSVPSTDQPDPWPSRGRSTPNTARAASPEPSPFVPQPAPALSRPTREGMRARTLAWVQSHLSAPLPASQPQLDITHIIVRGTQHVGQEDNTHAAQQSGPTHTTYHSGPQHVGMVHVAQADNTLPPGSAAPPSELQKGTLRGE